MEDTTDTCKTHSLNERLGHTQNTAKSMNSTYNDEVTV